MTFTLGRSPLPPPSPAPLALAKETFSHCSGSLTHQLAAGWLTFPHVAVAECMASMPSTSLSRP